MRLKNKEILKDIIKYLEDLSNYLLRIEDKL
jgi:hypothetical protein